MVLNVLLELKGEHPEYLKKFKGKIHKNRTMLSLKSGHEGTFDLSEYPKGKIVLETCESGGAVDSGMGLAQIFCDVDGNATKPVYIRRKGHLKNSKHAYFNLPAKKGLVILKFLNFGKSFALHLNRVNGIIFIGESVFKLDIEKISRYD